MWTKNSCSVSREETLIAHNDILYNQLPAFEQDDFDKSLTAHFKSFTEKSGPRIP
jgi:hypothetical protein